MKHGVVGAAQNGYFEASPNHDAIAFRVADDAQSEKIYNVIASLHGLRPYDFILPNYPSYDDMYEKPEGLWAYGTWVNGGHWSTCEARMMLGYYRLGKFDDARKSMQRLLTFAKKFRMDNPLVKFGSDVYQPTEPINLCYDTFGPAAGFMRGLFEYLYSADGLTLAPHIPLQITVLQQRDPVRFGKKLIYCCTVGSGPITGLLINGRLSEGFNAKTAFLPYAGTPDSAHVVILLGGAKPPNENDWPAWAAEQPVAELSDARLNDLDGRAATLREFEKRLNRAGLGGSYAEAHARLALRCMDVARERFQGLASGGIKPLPAASEKAADQSYIDTARKLCDGLDKVMATYDAPKDPAQKKIRALWLKSGGH